MPIRLFVLALLALVCANAWAVEVAGVRFDERMKVDRGDTVLNGAGLRGVLFIKAYAMALYLPRKTAVAADVLAMPGTKRLRIVTLRKLTAAQFADALISGIRKNHTDVEVARLESRIQSFNAALATIGASEKGAVIHLDWLPYRNTDNAGVTRLTVNAEQRGDDIPGADFYHAILKIWLGEHPVDARLMEALLGGPQKG